MQLENWLAFTSIAFMVADIPGPVILLVSTDSLQFGVLHLLFTVAGNIAGLFIMSARVANKIGLEDNPHNFLLMHAMGPNVAGVLGSTVAAGVLLALVGQ